MSNGKLLAKELSRELEAALLGDFGRLKKGSVDARKFAQSFSSQAGEMWWKESPPRGLLGIAAKGVSAERRGETKVALSLYSEVAGSSGWFRLLGLLLEGWSSVISDTEAIHAAAEEVRRIRRGERKARLLMKLAVFAADKGEVGTAHLLWKEATDASSERTKLGRALRIEEMNLGIRPQPIDLLTPPPSEPEDDLVFPPQMEELQLRGARGALEEVLDERLGGPWRWTIRMGRTPLDEVVTADLQATWIGLPWIRRPIRKQMGAQLLGGSASTSAQWAHGVLMWTLGGGSQYSLTLDYAEPHFDEQSGDFIVKGVGDCDPTTNRVQRLASLGAQAWDLISDEVLRWLVKEVPLMAGQGSPREESRTIWAAFAIRLTDEWFAQYNDLEPELQRALLDSLTPYSLRHFTDEMKSVMYQALSDDHAIVADGGALVPVAAALAPAAELDRLRQLLEQFPVRTRVIADLLTDQPELVSSRTLSRVLNGLQNHIKEQSQKKSIEIGSPGPRVELGRILSAMDNPEHQLIELLLDAATDTGAPPQYVTEARRGLLLLRRQGRLRVADLKRLRAAPDHRGQERPFDEGLSSAVMRMLLLQILAGKPTAAERSELMSAVRSHDERVRHIAVNACAEALATSDDEGLAWAVVSGLFDPSDVVASGALAGIGPLTARFRGASEVAWQRLPDLFASSERHVRRDVIDMLGVVKARTKTQANRKRALLVRARHDRSWIVRDEAATSTS